MESIKVKFKNIMDIFSSRLDLKNNLNLRGQMRRNYLVIY